VSGEQYRFEGYENGFLLFRGETPLGYLEAGSIRTPSGAEYTATENGAGGIAMRTPDGHSLVEYRESPEPAVRDTASGTEWLLKPDWLRTYTGAVEFTLEDLFIVEYTLEEAQGTVPNRVVLLLGFMMKCPAEDRK